MRLASALIVGALLAGCQTMQSPENAVLQVGVATAAWRDAFNRCDPAGIAALYDPQAVLWGTVSPTIATGPAIRQYFDKACGSGSPAKVAIVEQHIRVFGDTAINSGLYTFAIDRNGKDVAVPARFSMAFRKSGEHWLIVDHHSSLRPAPPKP